MYELNFTVVSICNCFAFIHINKHQTIIRIFFNYVQQFYLQNYVQIKKDFFHKIV